MTVKITSRSSPNLLSWLVLPLLLFLTTRQRVVAAFQPAARTLHSPHRPSSSAGLIPPPALKLSSSKFPQQQRKQLWKQHLATKSTKTTTTVTRPTRPTRLWADSSGKENNEDENQTAPGASTSSSNGRSSDSNNAAKNKNSNKSDPSIASAVPLRVNGEVIVVKGAEKSGDDDDDSAQKKKKSLLQKVKLYFVGSKKENDGLTFRQRLAKAGLSMVLSYGWVSNMSYCVTVSFAWYIFSKQTGLSPLAPGQWKKFLAVYAGFYVFNNIIRPIRFAAAAVVSPQFDKLVEFMQNRFGFSKTVAITLAVIAVNLVGTTTLMCAMIAGASALSGVPIFPPKATV